MGENEFQEFLDDQHLFFDNENDEVEFVKLFSAVDNLPEKYHDDAMYDDHLKQILKNGGFGGETEEKERFVIYNRVDCTIDKKKG